MTFPSGRLLRNISIAVRPVVRNGWYSDTSMTRSPPVGRLSPPNSAVFGQDRFADQHLLLPLMTSTLDLGPFVEHLNLDIRQRVAAIGRRVKTLGQGEASLRAPLALFHVYHNCVLPHAGLRQPRLIPEPTHGCGSAKVWPVHPGNGSRSGASKRCWATGAHRGPRCRRSKAGAQWRIGM